MQSELCVQSTTQKFLYTTIIKLFTYQSELNVLSAGCYNTTGELYENVAAETGGLRNFFFSVN